MLDGSWQGDRGQTLGEVCHWPANIAVKLRERTICIDVDKNLSEVLDAMPELRLTFGVFRKDAPDRAKFILHVDAPVRPAHISGLEILARNQTAVVYGRHASGAFLLNTLRPVIRVPYAWLDESWKTLTGMSIGDTPGLPEDQSISQNWDLRGPEACLSKAVQIAEPGTRHHTGLLLVLNLRRLGLNEAEATPLVEQYQQSVALRGEHPYSLGEARATLRSAYRDRKRVRPYVCPITGKHWRAIDYIAAFGDALLAGQIVLARRTRVVDLNVLLALLETATVAGQVHNLHASVRSFADRGITKSRAARSLKRLCRLGILVKAKGAAHGAPRSFDLGHLHQLAKSGGSSSPTMQKVGHIEGGVRGGEDNTYTAVHPSTCPTFEDDPSTPTSGQRMSCARELYRELSRNAVFIRGACVDLRLWSDEPPKYPLGETALTVVVELAGIGCATVRTLADGVGMSPGTISRALQALESVGIVSRYRVGRTIEAELVTDWRRVLTDLEPAMTTFGMTLRLQRQYLGNQVRFHSRFRTGISEETTHRSHHAIASVEKEYQEAVMRRREWCEARGVDFVELGPPPRSRDRKVLVHINGRRLAPERVARAEPRQADVEVIFREEINNADERL